MTASTRNAAAATAAPQVPMMRARTGQAHHNERAFPAGKVVWVIGQFNAHDEKETEEESGSRRSRTFRTRGIGREEKGPRYGKEIPKAAMVAGSPRPRADKRNGGAE